MADKPLYRLADDKHGAIATARLGRQRGTVGFGNARAVRNFFEQATARQASRIVSERAVGLAPDTWLITRDDMLGPRELDVSGSTALRELAGMRGLGMIKQQVSVQERVQGQGGILQPKYRYDRGVHCCCFDCKGEDKMA